MEGGHLKRLVLASALAFCGASLAGAQDVYTASRITLYSGLAFDLGTTEAAIRAGYTEANPILGQNSYRRIATATGLTLTADWMIRRYIRPEHPKLAIVLNFLSGSLHIGAGAWNLKYERSRNPIQPPGWIHPSQGGSSP